MRASMNSTNIESELEALKLEMAKKKDRREKHKLYIQIQELRKVYRQITGRNYKWQRKWEDQELK